ncbi:MAG: hypothetical protein Q9226_004515 [Calogaya cf. arnoldii]
MPCPYSFPSRGPSINYQSFPDTDGDGIADDDKATNLKKIHEDKFLCDTLFKDIGPDIETQRAESTTAYLHILCGGAPKLRALLRNILDQMIRGREKAIIFCQIPAVTKSAPGGFATPWPGVDFTTRTDEGKALSETPHGGGVAWLLVKHRGTIARTKKIANEGSDLDVQQASIGDNKLQTEATVVAALGWAIELGKDHTWTLTDVDKVDEVMGKSNLQLTVALKSLKSSVFNVLGTGKLWILVLTLSQNPPSLVDVSISDLESATHFYLVNQPERINEEIVTDDNDNVVYKEVINDWEDGDEHAQQWNGIHMAEAWTRYDAEEAYASEGEGISAPYPTATST